MSKIYLPHAEQFDLMNENLAKIANALASDIDLSTWAGIQKAVRVGVAPDIIPVGTQFVVSHSLYGDMLYDVVAHNHFKSAHDENAHTMTLMCHDLIPVVQYDKGEAFFYAENELSAGTYQFSVNTTRGSWKAGAYHFTLTRTVPKGGQLCISDATETPLTGLNVRSFADSFSTEPIEAVAISSGEGGQVLGTLGEGSLNHTDRVAYGSGNYKESAIRQFLNSSAVAGSVWSPQTKFDRPPSWKAHKEGFMRGFTDDFLAVIGEVSIPCYGASYESPDSTVSANTPYTVNDKFYIASVKEINGDSSMGSVDLSQQFSYYKGSTTSDIIKYKDGVATDWYTRSSSSGGSAALRVIRSTGLVSSLYPVGEKCCAPVCTIV